MGWSWDHNEKKRTNSHSGFCFLCSLSLCNLSVSLTGLLLFFYFIFLCLQSVLSTVEGWYQKKTFFMYTKFSQWWRCWWHKEKQSSTALVWWSSVGNAMHATLILIAIDVCWNSSSSHACRLKFNIQCCVRQAGMLASTLTKYNSSSK